MSGNKKSVVPRHSCSILIIGLSLIGREVQPDGLSPGQVVKRLPNFAKVLASVHVTFDGTDTIIMLIHNKVGGQFESLGRSKPTFLKPLFISWTYPL